MAARRPGRRSLRSRRRFGVKIAVWARSLGDKVRSTSAIRSTIVPRTVHAGKMPGQHPDRVALAVLVGRPFGRYLLRARAAPADHQAELVADEAVTVECQDGQE